MAIITRSPLATAVEPAETAPIAVGEYPPFVEQNELDYGVTAAIVKAVWVSELVGANAAKTLFGKDPRATPLQQTLVWPMEYYFIVSRTLPDAKKWRKRFNTGLSTIQTNGRYQQIIDTNM
jgi:ABC-type amino acid transport substrate-binding protein